MIAPELLSLLACPVCKGPLKAAETKLTCPKCARDYAVVDGIPDLVP